MRITICWSELSGYMAACWRALANMPGVSLHVLAMRAGGTPELNPFEDKLVRGFDCRLLTGDEVSDSALIQDTVARHRPDLVIVSGWYHAPYRKLARCEVLRGTKFAVAMDTPWRGTLRQRLARLKLGRFLSRMSGAIVAGERSWSLARRLGFDEGRIVRGVYGFDEALFGSVARERLRSGGWPKRFLFMGRYVQAKGIDTLLDAYVQYRRAVAEPWPLACFGHGPLIPDPGSIAGLEVNPFVQPPDQPPILAGHGVLVLPSRYEPWGVVVAEAMYSGMPVICTEAVGATVELLRPLYNGLSVPTEDARGLARAMQWMHEHHDRLPEMGQNAVSLASAYTSLEWAKRIREFATLVVVADSERHTSHGEVSAAR